jgi:hypothetical protein
MPIGNFLIGTISLPFKKFGTKVRINYAQKEMGCKKHGNFTAKSAKKRAQSSQSN